MNATFGVCGVALASLALGFVACGGDPRTVTAPVARSASTTVVATSDPPPQVRTISALTAVSPHPRYGLSINMDAVRRHPRAARTNEFLREIAPWHELGAGLDPLRDTDWLVYTGPSLVANAKSAFLVHFKADDATVDAAVHAMPEVTVDGEPRPIEVPKVKARLGTVDQHPRWIFRPTPHLLAIVPSRTETAPRARSSTPSSIPASARTRRSGSSCGGRAARASRSSRR